MTSASAPERARGGGALAAAGLLAGAAAGACVGLADTLRAILVTRNELVQGSDALRVVDFYALAFAPFGVAASFLARLFAMPARALHLLASIGAAAGFALLWMNVELLPGFLESSSLAADAAVLVAAALIFRSRYRHTARDGMRVRPWFLAGVASALVAAALGLLVPARDAGEPPVASAPPGAKRPNVLLYVVDTLRADHLGCYGYEPAKDVPPEGAAEAVRSRPKSPTSAEIDAFAKESALFRDCRAVTSWTKPSVASLFTSLHPTMHGCVEPPQVLAPAAETLAEILKAAGWRTAAFSDNPFVSPEFGLGQGFDDFRYVRPSVVVNGTLLGKALFMTRVLSLVGKPFGVGERVERGAAALHADLLAECGKAGGAPWFAYVHAMEPHLPYEPAREDAVAMGIPAGQAYETPPPYNGVLPFVKDEADRRELAARLVAQYDAEIRGFSREFGKLLAELGRRGILENTIVVLTSDHGEEFHEHGGWTHGHSLHREVTQVPLLVRLPGSLGDAATQSRGRRIAGVATLLDVTPTLLDLCSVKHPRGDAVRAGESLRRQIEGEGGQSSSAVKPRMLLGEVSIGPVGIRTIQDAQWQLFVARHLVEERTALYPAADVRQQTDRSGAQPVEVRDLRLRLDDAFRTLARAALEGRAREIDGETLERLRRLGYVGAK